MRGSQSSQSLHLLPLRYHTPLKAPRAPSAHTLHLAPIGVHHATPNSINPSRLDRLANLSVRRRHRTRRDAAGRENLPLDLRNQLRILLEETL